MTVDNEYLKETNAERWQEYYEFFAELVLTVLQKLDEPTRWDKVIDHALYEYKGNRDRYIDLDVSGILTRTSRGDWWVQKKYMNSAKGRKSIKIVLEENGYYIASPPGQGIILADEPKEIKADFSRSIKSVRSRTNSLNRTAVATNKKKQTDLPMIVTNTLLKPPPSEDLQ